MLDKAIDLSPLRNHFPALQQLDDKGRPYVYFDGPGGTQVPRVVIDAMSDYFINANANCGGPFITSHRNDDMIDQARVELDREDAKNLWWDAQQIIVDDAPYAFLFVTDEVVAVDRRVRNVRPTTYSWDYNLFRWWVPTAEQRYPDW